MGSVLRRLVMFCGLTWALAAGCISPTLPLPPPDEPRIEGPDANGMVTLSGQVPKAEAWVYGVNGTQVDANDPNAIGGDRADPAGGYRFQIRGDVGDHCYLYYQYADEQSQDRYFDIPAPAGP